MDNEIDFHKYFPYKSIREQQEYILSKLPKSKKRFLVIEAAPGTGKSAIAKTLANYYASSYILTATKQLQDQYKTEFNDICIMKGSSNYKCSQDNYVYCNMAICNTNHDIKFDCIKNSLCPYYNAKARAEMSKNLVTSYSYFFTFMKDTDIKGSFAKRDLLVIDECHLLEQQLTSWASINLTFKELDNKYNFMPIVQDDFSMFISLSAKHLESGYTSSNQQYIQDIFICANKRIEQLSSELKLHDVNSDEYKSTIKTISSLKNLSRKMNVFIKSVNKNQFIIEPIGEGAGLTIQPLKVETLFTEYMNPWATKKVIFMSATILNVKLFCEELGISREDVDIIRVGSAFDPKKSPIYYVPAGKMNYKSLSSTMPNIIKYVDKIIDKHYMDKGIIHTGNYQIATDIKSNSKYADRLLLRSGYETNEDLIKRHCNSPEPTILLSPSLSTGTDLRDDLSRFQVVVKMPFASLADKRVKIKSDLNPEWYACEMLRTLIQSCGRSTRSEDDYSSTYILDSSLYYWLRKYHNLIPSQFKDRIVWPKN